MSDEERGSLKVETSENERVRTRSELARYKYALDGVVFFISHPK